MSEVKVSRKTFDGVCVFVGAFIAQALVPSPFDHCLFPGALAYWWVQSNQQTWVFDYAYQNASVWKDNMSLIASDLISKYTNPASQGETDRIEEGAVDEAVELSE